MLMYRMLCGLVMDVCDPLTLTFLSLLYRFVKCSLHSDSSFTAEHVLSRMVSLSHALSLITLYSRFRPVYRLYDLLIHPNTISHFFSLDNSWSPFEFTRSSYVASG
jgi:hypothetical protein